MRITVFFFISWLLAACGFQEESRRGTSSLSRAEYVGDFAGFADADANNGVNPEEFLERFNQYRAQYGLSPVQLSQALTDDAAQNNVWQQRNGLGHFYMGGAQAQNSAMGYAETSAVMNGWHNSGGHRVNMQNRNWRCMGIHKAGSYWTQNFSAGKVCQ